MPRLELDAICGVGSNHSKTYHPQKWTAPLGYRIVERLAIILALSLVLTFYSIWAEDFPIRVVGFPIGLSPRTMQGLGSVQNLWFFLFCTWFPHRLESEDHARPRFCPKVMIFLLYLVKHYSLFRLSILKTRLNCFYSDLSKCGTSVNDTQ